ncbi:helix-turn-helix domain-containing protein, partial [Clostridium neonatale]
KAKEYIKNNYMDSDISVEKLCSELHISPTYFSTIFKKETDMSFVNYLTEIRLEEAIKLLNTTDYKTYIIAEKVGYQEANYFSYVFKKKFKVSPSKYRKS